MTPSAGGCDDPKKYHRKERSCRPTRVEGGHPRDQQTAASRSLAAPRSPQQKSLDCKADMEVGVLDFLMDYADANRLYLFHGFSLF